MAAYAVAYCAGDANSKAYTVNPGTLPFAGDGCPYAPQGRHLRLIKGTSQKAAGADTAPEIEGLDISIFNQGNISHSTTMQGLDLRILSYEDSGPKVVRSYDNMTVHGKPLPYGGTYIEAWKSKEATEREEAGRNKEMLRAYFNADGRLYFLELFQE